PWFANDIDHSSDGNRPFIQIDRAFRRWKFDLDGCAAVHDQRTIITASHPALHDSRRTKDGSDKIPAAWHRVHLAGFDTNDALDWQIDWACVRRRIKVELVIRSAGGKD